MSYSLQIKFCNEVTGETEADWQLFADCADRLLLGVQIPMQVPGVDLNEHHPVRVAMVWTDQDGTRMPVATIGLLCEHHIPVTTERVTSSLYSPKERHG